MPSQMSARSAAHGRAVMRKRRWRSGHKTICIARPRRGLAWLTLQQWTQRPVKDQDQRASACKTQARGSWAPLVRAAGREGTGVRCSACGSSATAPMAASAAANCQQGSRPATSCEQQGPGCRASMRLGRSREMGAARPCGWGGGGARKRAKKPSRAGTSRHMLSGARQDRSASGSKPRARGWPCPAPNVWPRPCVEELRARA